MVIDEKLINYLEDLSFITLSGEERGRICADLKNIIAGMELLSTLEPQVQTSAQAPSPCFKTSFREETSFRKKTSFRRDEVLPSFPRSEILKNAPQANGETFIVPKTIE